MTQTTTRRPVRLDTVCAGAVEEARGAVLAALDNSADSSAVGDHVEVIADGERLVTHMFDCLLPGYRGWRWSATVTRAPRAKQVTVCETALLPGPTALRPPAWLPWEERVQPGDLSAGELLPTAPDDERLVPGYVSSGDPAIEELAWEFGLGRPRVLGLVGRTECATRWYEGDSGPHAEISRSAPEGLACAGCGFYLPLAGSLRDAFGVCGNMYAPDDARVVSVDHGCGAHSEVIAESSVETVEMIYDDGLADLMAADSEMAEGAALALVAEGADAAVLVADQGQPDGDASDADAEPPAVAVVSEVIAPDEAGDAGERP